MKNQNDIEKKYPEIYRRHKRKVISHPNGIITHDGDCGLYNIHLKICTCGLHHILLPLGIEDIKQIYSEYFKELIGKSLVESLLIDKEDCRLWTLCSSCEGTGKINVKENETSFIIELIRCEQCKGKGFVLFDNLIHQTDLEIEKEMRDMFKRLEEKEKNMEDFKKLSKDLNLDKKI